MSAESKTYKEGLVEGFDAGILAAARVARTYLAAWPGGTPDALYGKLVRLIEAEIADNAKFPPLAIKEDRSLHLFKIGPDTVIAFDPEDAWEVWCQHSGENRSDYHASEDAELIPDSRVVVLAHDDAPAQSAECCLNWCADMNRPTDWTGHHPSCSLTHDRKTAAEWAKNGRGFFSSSEH